MPQHTTQTFFLPPRHSTLHSTLSAESYNLSFTLLKRSESDHLFVPVRSMQYLAIIDGHDIWFVDSQAYAVNEAEGGRMITVSWHVEKQLQRNALDQPVPMRIHFYHKDMSSIQQRLRGEFLRAMQQLDQRYRDQQIPSEGAHIIDLRAGGS
jgi:hypothetical protein